MSYSLSRTLLPGDDRVLITAQYGAEMRVESDGGVQ